MKIVEILNVLQKRLPLYTSWFSEKIDVIDAEVANNRITFKTDVNHELTNDQTILVANAQNACHIVEIQSNPPIYNLKTAEDHGLSYDRDDLKVEIASPLTSEYVDVIAINSPTSLTISTTSTISLNNSYLLLEEGFNGFSK